ncbi:DMT family transporter [Pantoea phytobeneficialis]|uniref:Threonine/homoserine exporter RhtA n=1 Tax=Pantoea phytobeneficialis TaxID=2052056 RepID=A0AAP9HBJ4_9GAMM|nr:DMT family transporter [Pantoea phytobeneficialis]MDO6409905.1 DMT family transporter [Pantoea phytobeneficialis]QGR09774.1 hypothetical protein CTZ24_25305 [Pantoea phytobeneficialis]
MLRKHSGVLCVAMCYILFGISYPVAKQAMDSIPTWTFTFITFLIGLAALFPLSLMIDKTRWLAVSLRDWAAIGVQALFGAVLYTVFLLYGLPDTSAVAASVITSVAPAFVLIFSVIFLREKLTLKSGFAVLLAVLSVIVMTVPTTGNDGHSNAYGLFFLALSTLSTALVIIFAKKLSSQLPPVTMATGVCLVGAVLSFPLSLTEGGDFHLLAISQSQAITLVYYGLFVWALPYVFFFHGIWKVRASTAGMTVALVPVAAMLAGALFFGERLTITDVAATTLIVASIVIAEVNLKRRLQPEMTS